MTIIGPLLVLFLGILLVTVWSVHLVLFIFGWIFIVAAGVWLVRYLIGNSNSRQL